MAIVTGARQYDEILQAATVKVLTLSGTVEVDGSPAVRNLIIYKNSTSWSSPFYVTSEADGTFTVDIPGGSNDQFTVICYGKTTDENSAIFSHITE